MKQAKVRRLELLVAGRYAAELLDLGEQSLDPRAYASRVPQNRAATKDFFEKMAVEGRCEPFLGDAQFLWMRLQQRQRQAA